MKNYYLTFLLLSNTLFGSQINTDAKAITLLSTPLKDGAVKIADSLSQYDTYIYRTTSTKVPQYIVYAINIPKSNLKATLSNIKEHFKDAYVASDSRVKYLSANNYTDELFAKSKRIALTTPVASLPTLVKPTVSKIVEQQTAVNKEEVPATTKTTKKKFVLDLYYPNSTTTNIQPRQEEPTSVKTLVKEIRKNKDTQINPAKKAINVGTTSTLNSANVLVSKYNKYDNYVFNTIRNGRNAYVVYVVNIEPSQFNHVLHDIQLSNPTATEASRVKIKYFARGFSKEDRFVASNNFGTDSVPAKINTEVAINDNYLVQSDVYTVVPKIVKINNNVMMPVHNHALDSTKKAIFLGYATTQSGVEYFKQTYKNEDLFVYDTVKDGQYVHAIYIVNIELSQYESKFHEIKQYNNEAQDVSRAKIKYFALNNSSTDQFYASNDKSDDLDLLSDVKSLNTFEPVASVEPKLIKQEPIVQKLESDAKHISNNNENQIKIIDTTANNDIKIDKTKKAVTVCVSQTLKDALNALKRLPKKDYYIYKTTSTNKPLYIIYAVNISKGNLISSLLELKQVFSDAYISSDNRVSTLASNNSLTQNIFIGRNEDYTNVVAQNTY